jgi:nucleotide-binding universal stress UspA family protein
MRKFHAISPGFSGRLKMIILLAGDGSSYTTVAVKALQSLSLPSQTELIALTVVPETFFGGMVFSKFIKFTGRAQAVKQAQQEQALEIIQDIIQMLGSKKFKIERMIRWGNPAEVILKVADESKAAMVIMGEKGLTDSVGFRLGGVTETIMKQATASVLITRMKATTTNRVLVATDGSKYSDLVIQFLLKLPLPQSSEVIQVLALQSRVENLLRTQTLDLRTDQQLLADIRTAEESATQRIAARGEEQFKKKGYDTTTVVVRGAAAESVLKVADQYDVDIIAVGRKGQTRGDTAPLGSVAEKVARYAQCTVLIGPAKSMTSP